MILIADSGGSKTDWALISLPTDTSKYVLKVRTQGVNPFSSVEGCYFEGVRAGAKACAMQGYRAK